MPRNQQVRGAREFLEPGLARHQNQQCPTVNVTLFVSGIFPGIERIMFQKLFKSAAIAVLGSASDVGKSVVAAGLCRLLADAGLDVVPFKAQNMANQAGVTA